MPKINKANISSYVITWDFCFEVEKIEVLWAMNLLKRSRNKLQNKWSVDEGRRGIRQKLLRVVGSIRSILDSAYRKPAF